MVARIESVLLLLFAAGIILIAQPWLSGLYHAGLLAIFASTLLIIVVGNVPVDLPLGRAATRAGVLLLALVAVLGTGYLLVPILAGLGR